jgi:hypothetical protein
MASSNIRVAFCFVRCPRHVTSRLWMNFILIELNMTCKAPHNLTPVFLFWCPYILLCNYLFIFLKIIPFWVLTIAFISPCVVAHVIFDFFNIHELIYVSSFHVLSFDLTIFLWIPNIVVGLCCAMWSWIPKFHPQATPRLFLLKCCV